MHCFPFPERLKSMFFETFSSGGSLKQKGSGVTKKFQKMLILVFEVQSPKHTFKIGILSVFVRGREPNENSILGNHY